MPQGYHHLDRDQRCQLYALMERGDSLTAIAQVLGVHRSTVCRELKRNTGKRGYRYKQADEKAQQRRNRACQVKKKMTPAILAIIEEKLRLQWSPVQISGWLKKNGYAKAVSHETIYQHVWQDKHNGGSLYRELRHHGKKYNKRSKGAAGRGCIPNRIDIKERPSIIEEKSRLGDWELDTIIYHNRPETWNFDRAKAPDSTIVNDVHISNIDSFTIVKSRELSRRSKSKFMTGCGIGAGQSGAIVSMVERTSKLTKLAKVSRKTAEETEAALVEKLNPIREFVCTLTADNGKEFANHQKVGSALDADFYFATPYHSWERGLNEHTNGLVRQYFPKSKRFDQVSMTKLEGVEVLLNNRPRKILNFSTPLEIFTQLSERAAASRLLVGRLACTPQT